MSRKSEYSEFSSKVGTSPAANRRTQREQASYDLLTAADLEAESDMGFLGDKARRWTKSGNKYWSTSPTEERIPAGVYTTGNAPTIGFYVDRQPINTDNLLELPDDAVMSVLNEFEAFWGIENRFRERGFLFKRGYLLWGPPGSGKTSGVHLLISRVVNDLDGIAIMVDHPSIAAGCLKMLREVEPRRPLICIMEDIDALINKHGESGYLALLDGEAQIDNVSFVATTNYPELLDRRFVDRPSRFDTIRYVGMPSAAAREVYLRKKEPSLTDEEIKLWVSASDGFSVAHLKEMIIAVRCFKQPLGDVVDRLEAMGSRLPTSEESPDRIGVGFTTARPKLKSISHP